MCFDIQRVRCVLRLRRRKTKRLHGLTFGLISGASRCVMVCIGLNIGLHGVYMGAMRLVEWGSG